MFPNNAHYRCDTHFEVVEHPDHEILSRTYLANSDFFFPRGEGAEPHWTVQTSKLILIQRLNKILLRKITFPVFHLI